ncbi:MAG TPA: hypothetical protein VFE82_04910 [Ramlibacter sp.]|jgi:hypothetical protein|uniref:hypothetical protein n=1 Tax=Ramlibacter sp. TaxID=1917967 RepID=UPI002D4CC1A1|nr:hypothetical protein [Ramlibacter sp.]HZY17798.1 hypothetical protein [Ramlibacter sp.]
MDELAFPRNLVSAAVERAKSIPPLFGPGWDVCFVDEGGAELARYTVAHFEQITHLEAELGRLGFKLLLTEGSRCDFVFGAASLDTQF